jgi:shikimate dehydrogenase
MTRLFGIIGHPIGHSLSPAMHNAAFKALRLDACYVPCEVPAAQLRPMLEALVLAGVEGLNVTVPLKERVLPLLHAVDREARAIGAVNTLVVRNRKLTGYNTDGAGFSRALKELRLPTRPLNSVLLGAGGAARAVAWELTRRAGSTLLIANRHPARAARLARWLSAFRPRARIRAASLSQVRLDGRVDLLVNATTVGLRAGDRAPVDVSGLRPPTRVYDLIYARETALLREAARRGCVAAGGSTMLLYQGAEALQLWLGRAAPLAVMRDALRRAPAGHGSRQPRQGR